MIYSCNKLLFVFLAIAIWPVSSVQAQADKARHHSPPDAEMRIAHLTRALHLNDEQSAELLEVFQAVDEERQALRQQAMQQMKPQICELQRATEDEITRILDDEQLARLEEIKAERNSDHRREGWRGMDELDCSSTGN